MKKHNQNWQRERFIVGVIPQKTVYVEIFCVLYSVIW